MYRCYDTRLWPRAWAATCTPRALRARATTHARRVGCSRTSQDGAALIRGSRGGVTTLNIRAWWRHWRACWRVLQVTTGEENESNVFQLNAKLFAFDSAKRVWLEKGRGALRLNDMQSDDNSTAFQSRLGNCELHFKILDLAASQWLLPTV